MAAKSYPNIYHDEPQSEAKVAVLMGLHNGATYLPDQLNSLARQTHQNWHLIVADDGSTDGGADIVRSFGSSYSATLTSGSGKGFARTYLKLLNHIPRDARFAAFCDQDDLWIESKLARAISLLADVPEGIPALYAGRTVVTDHRLNPYGLSPLFTRVPGFANALVQSIAGGNTMVFNRPATNILQRASRYPGPIPSHDWWAYQVVSGAGGRVIYDPLPQVLYRQHSCNLVGANTGAIARLQRIQRLLTGQMSSWNAQNIAALSSAGHVLTAQAQETLGDFARLRRSSFTARITGLAQSGLYRQTRLGTGALWLANSLGRL